jgi:RNA polymerase sigma-70 factor (ECF subfamily)
LHSVEKEILNCFKEGDDRAMELLYDNYGDAFYGIALKIVSDEAIATDVLQDAFVKVWKKSANYDSSKGRLFTWVLSIVRNQAIDALRKTGRRGEIHGDMADVSISNEPSDSNNPDIAMDAKTMLSKLDSDKRSLIEHSYILGYSHPEIAEKFDLPLGTVKTRIRNAMKELREIFGNGR